MTAIVVVGISDGVSCANYVSKKLDTLLKDVGDVLHRNEFVIDEGSHHAHHEDNKHQYGFLPVKHPRDDVALPFVGCVHNAMLLSPVR